MSDKKINMIQTLGANFATNTDPNAPADDKSSQDLVKVVVSSLVRGFREDTLDGDQIRAATAALTEIGADLGSRLHLPDVTITPQAKQLLGLMWLGQIAQASWAGMLTDDPVVALALNEVWNTAHTEMNVAGLTETQQDRYADLMAHGTDDFDPIQETLEAVSNFNQSGCPCGKGHAIESHTDGLSAGELIKGLDGDVLQTLRMIASISGKSMESLVENMRDSYLAGAPKGSGAANLLAMALGALEADAEDADAPKLDAGVVEVTGDSHEAIVEKLYGELTQGKRGDGWTVAQRANLKDQIRKNLPAILAGGPVRIEIDLTK